MKVKLTFAIVATVMALLSTLFLDPQLRINAKFIYFYLTISAILWITLAYVYISSYMADIRKIKALEKVEKNIHDTLQEKEWMEFHNEFVL